MAVHIRQRFTDWIRLEADRAIRRHCLFDEIRRPEYPVFMALIRILVDGYSLL